MEELRQKIVETINQSKLPADCIYYLIKDIYREISDAYFSQMAKMAQSAVNDKKEEEKGE